MSSILHVVGSEYIVLFILSIMIAIVCGSSYCCNFVALPLDDYAFDLQTMRVWQGSEHGSYNCGDILKDHTAEALLVTFFS